MEEKVVLILTDKTRVELFVNGSCYVTTENISKDLFDDSNLLEVNVNGQDHTNMTCTNFFKKDGYTWIVLRDKTPMELKEMQREADIEFLLAMQGVIR